MLKRIWGIMALLLIFSMVGCRKKEEPLTIAYSMSGTVTSLDQQFVTKKEPQGIIRGLFTPLLTIDQDGTLQYCGATNYEVSADGLRYTFRIREDLLWSDGTPVTAKDYAFGISRLFGPVVSDIAPEYGMIANANEVMAGTLSLDALGVQAPDNRTLEITLSAPSGGFLYSLVNTAVLPCKESFFLEQKGRYAVSKDTLLTCGVFSLAEWSPNKIRLVPAENHPIFTAQGDITVLLGSSSPAQDFKDGKSNIYTIPFREISAFEGYSYIPLDRQSYCLFVNPKHKGLAYSDIRRDVIAAATTSLSDIDLGKALPTEGILSSDVTIDGRSYREITGSILPEQGSFSSAHSFTQMVQAQGMDKLPGITISYPATQPGEAFANAMHLSLRDNLAVNTNLEALTEEQLISRLASGNYDMMIAPLSAMGTDAMGYLSYLSGLYSFREEIMNQTLSAKTIDELTNIISQLERYLMQEALVIPLYDAPSRGVYQTPVTGLYRQAYTGIVVPEGFILRR